MVGIECHGSLIVGDRVDGSSLRSEGNAQIVVCIRIVRPQRQRAQSEILSSSLNATIFGFMSGGSFEPKFDDAMGGAANARTRVPISQSVRFS